jgi:glycerol-3-phosphate O-acyltransferase
MAIRGRPVKEAENRLSGFNAERPTILADVERRVNASRTEAARRGGDHSLEYVLNDVAYQEIRRLEASSSSPSEKKRLAEWRDLARRLGSMTEEEKRRRLAELVHAYADDVAGNFDTRVYGFARGVMPRLLSAVLSPQSLSGGLSSLGDLSRRIEVQGPMDQLRVCADRGTLVVTPTHVSNLDSVVMGYSLDWAGLPPCTYGAGKNLWSNPFLGFFMRNLGAYRVDRRLKNGLYLEVLKEYSTVVLERGYHQMFFPGGTRSRSGALEKKLKLGLLGTAMTAYGNHLREGKPNRRCYVVPATINMGITLEAETLIEDYLAEQGKQRYIIEDDEATRLSRVVDFARKILTMEGAVVIRYGRALDPFGNVVDDDGESHDARGRRVDPARYLCGDDGRFVVDPQRDAEYTRGTGDEIARAFRRETVFLPTQLVARCLYDRIAAREKTRDVYRLLRTGEGFEVAFSALQEDVDRLRLAISGRPEAGLLHERVRGMRPAEVIEDALRAYKGYHARPVAERYGDVVAVRHLRLHYYYQNRTDHLGSWQ